MAQNQPTVNLKILSPSPELEAGVSFAQLPASTTVKQLRSRIRDAVPSKPAPERMRLIYRGRVVANDAATLLQVFGADNLRENNDQSLHLVLRELPSAASSFSEPAPQSQAAATSTLPASPPLQTNPFRSLPTPRPHSQPPGPQPYHPPAPSTLESHAHQTVPSNQPPDRAMSAPLGAFQPHPPAPGQTPSHPFAQANPPLQGGRTVRQEGIGPNGERWSVTINESNVNIPNLPHRLQQGPLPRPFHLPPGFGLGIPPRHSGSPSPADVIDRLLPRIRAILQSARQEMDNVWVLFQMPNQQPTHPAPQLAAANPPSWRIDHIRGHLQTMTQNLDFVERGLAVILADASMSQNADVVSLRHTANQLRSHAEEMNRRLASEQSGTAASQNSAPSSELSSSVLSGLPGPFPIMPMSAQQAPNTALRMHEDAPGELFILSSPQGPVGILFDQQGTYTTAPMVSTLPFQTFTNQFVQNRQLITGLGQQLAREPQLLHNQLANTQPTQTRPSPSVGEHNRSHTHDQAQNQAPNPNPDQNQNRNQNNVVNANPDQNAQPEQDRMLNIAGHLWLIFKLACFVYFFAGGGGLYRPVMLGIIAGVVYLAQIGIFEERFDVIRRHFEALLPVGALADRAAQPRNVDARPNNNYNDQPRNDAMNALTPEQAAQRLLQQQRDRRLGWMRESMRTLERSFAIFVASLWPGIGERMVHAQEERIRAERAAEEERLRLEEEARAQSAETREQVEEIASEDENGQPSIRAKGKEKAGSEPVSNS